MKRLPLSILSFLCLALAVTGQEPARLDLQLDREFYRASAENTLYLMATTRTGNPLGEAVRPRLNLALVVDRSGSMEGSRLEGAKEAARAARAQLSSGDRLTLIAFGSEVDTVIPSTPIDPLVGFEAAVHALRAGGGAALFDALSQAAAQLRRHASPQSVERILLVCDGPPTRGPLETEDFARLGASLSSEGIALSAIGVGDEYPAELLYQLASGSGGALRGARDPSDLVCVFGEAMPTRLLELPEARYLAQIGFGSGLDADSWRRPPLHLVAVVDKSGSMSGQPLQLVRESLLSVIEQMDERDRLSIVLYGSSSYVHLEPTTVSWANRSAIKSAIREIQSGGSTNMERGLQVGYSLAERSAAGHEGATRLMLFTDERPNTGNTSKEGFMALMRSGSDAGIGLTTIGVGVQFGAELANKISSARGGNLFYFPERDTMVDTFKNEFDTMVTELAHDMELGLTPARGYRIAGVYGIPGDMLEWDDDGRSLRMRVETLFLSRRQGAIYFALAPETQRDLPAGKGQVSEPVAEVSLAYEEANGIRAGQAFAFVPLRREGASLGLRRGELLLNQYLSLKKATTAYYVDNDQEQAYQVVSELASLLGSVRDPALEAEREAVAKLERELALLAGRRGEQAGESVQRRLRHSERSRASLDAVNVNPYTGLPVKN